MKICAHCRQLLYTSVFLSSVCTAVGAAADGGYVRDTSAHAPGQSERLWWILDYPGACGEVVCGVVVAVAAQTWQMDELLLTLSTVPSKSKVHILHIL